MPRFHYIAIAAQGSKTKGTITAESPYAARKQLRVRGIHPTSLDEIKTSEAKATLSSIFKKSSKAQLIDFTKQMSTLLNSGIKLTEALTVMTIQTSDIKFKNALSDIRDRVITGESFTDALKDYGDYFDIIYISMIRVGEVTGSLGNVFATIASFMEKRQKVESKVITAMVYPIILLFFCFVAIFILTTVVIPKIATQFASTGRELPWITRQLMNVSHVLRSWYLLIVIAVIAAIVYAVKKFFKTEKGAFLKDKFLLSLPLFGPLIKQRVVSRFASTLSTLFRLGPAHGRIAQKSSQKLPATPL